MKFRWTMKDLQTMTDTEILRGLVAERQSELNPHAPLAKRLQQIYGSLSQKIETDRETASHAA